jgi:hypothetical protein
MLRGIAHFRVQGLYVYIPLEKVGRGRDADDIGALDYAE